MKYIQLLVLGLLPLFAVGCKSFEEELEVTPTEQSAKILRFPIGQLLQPSTRSRQMGTAEDVIDNVMVAGVPVSNFNKTGMYLDVPATNLNRAFFFIANLTPEGQTRVKKLEKNDAFVTPEGTKVVDADGAEVYSPDGHTLLTGPDLVALRIEDYLDPNGLLKDDRYIPMVALLENAKSSHFIVPPGETIPVYSEKIELTRLFARLDLSIIQGNNRIKSVSIQNVPTVFTLGGAFGDYDYRAQEGSTAFELELPAPDEYNNVTTSCYLPEYAVSNPVFNDPDDHRMMCVQVKFVDSGGKEHTKKARLGFESYLDGDMAIGKEGKIVRNFIYSRTINLDDDKGVDGAPF